MRVTLEKQLIEKTYYENSFINKNETGNPVAILGEIFLEEQEKNVANLSEIRYAQGEVYYHYKDFEAAIFKWENIKGELEPWAQKNIADAYFELGIYSTAEDIYKSINTDSLVLKTEVALQLFSLYIEQEKLPSADLMIKQAVSLNPDYPNVTKVARAFYEEHRDWDSAIELSINEAIRTKSLEWFDVLKTYIDKGVTKTIKPDYFTQALTTLYTVDQTQFEQLVLSIWKSFENQSSFLSWLREINQLLLDLEFNDEDSWENLGTLYEKTYLKLLDGTYLIKQLSAVMPSFLAVWLKITNTSKSAFVSSAVLAWEEAFPSKMDATIVSEAEYNIHHAENNLDGLQYSLHLFQSIKEWARDQGLEVGYKYKWIIQKLMDLQAHHVLIAGTSGNGKSTFIHSILGERIVDGPSTSTIMMLQDDDDISIKEITDTEIRQITNLSDYLHTNGPNANSAYVDIKLPSKFLKENYLRLIDTPSLSGNNEKQILMNNLHVADSLLFVLNAGTPFTDHERHTLLEIKKRAPELPIHFILNKVDTYANEQEAMKVVDDTFDRINNDFPDAKTFAYSDRFEGKQQLQDLTDFIKSHVIQTNGEKERTKKLLFYIRKVITYLLQQRVEAENDLIESIRWNEDMLAKMNGSINQLQDVENEKIDVIQQSYRKIKEEMKSDLEQTIPELLQSCSELITEDSDFKNIHVQLNDEMNNRVQNYLEQTALPRHYRSFQQWIEGAQQELAEGQSYLEETSEGLNALFGEKRLKLQCDFRILDDWRRDADRMVSAVQIDEENILLRRTPTQFLLKSAGKLFGAIRRNKELLYNKYTDFIENEEYLDVTNSIINKFLLQFELFEKTLERDISMFFRNSFDELEKNMEEIQREMEANEKLLNDMKANPEMYRDPLTLFELRLRQYEWILHVDKEKQSVF